ncbi:MAG: hypothetical protein KC423_21500 [Anaerolineales bacterium]|nr:hypothetical protein [Anaerolineales bacterium]
MKTAQTSEGKPLIAASTAPKQAICPHCGGTVTLRNRKTMNNGERIYFWRHKSNLNRNCSGRTRPI